MQVWPSEARKVTRFVGTVVSQQEHSVPNNVFICVLDADIGVGCGDVVIGIVLKSLLCIVGEDDKRSWSLERVLVCFGRFLVHNWRCGLVLTRQWAQSFVL